MTTLLDEVLSELRPEFPRCEFVLKMLRVPETCRELEPVANACESALTQISDYHDSPILLDSRDCIRGLLRLLSKNSHLSRTDYRSVDAVPSGMDDAYRSLPRRSAQEPWWRETLREALVARLLLSSDHASVAILADALRTELPIGFTPPKPQKCPSIRATLLVTCLEASEQKYSRLAQALRDTTQQLEKLPAVRTEPIHPENAAALKAFQEAQTKPPPDTLPRERLGQLTRDISTAAIAQRREYHSPPAQRLPQAETLHELLRRAQRWDSEEQTALHSILVLGRLSIHLLRSGNRDRHCAIVRNQHETWIRRHLPETAEFVRNLGGPGYARVTQEFHIPLPRRLGYSLCKLVCSRDAISTLRQIERKLREFSREYGQSITLRRLSRVFEHALEDEPPDEALATLLGLQPIARRDAGIHYFSPSTTTLVGRIQATVGRICAQHDLDALDEGWSAPPPELAPYVGYSYRAETAAIQALIESLKSLAELGRGRTAPGRIIEAYNARVALLALMYLAATGARPTGTVLPSHEEISFEDHVALVSEKDSLGYRSTRLVPLNKRFVTEVTEFKKWAHAKRLLPQNASSETSLAMLQHPEGTFVAPTITALKQLIPAFGEHWVWPDDMLRHLFRSRLWELNCPSSWLRRVMGHHPPHGAKDMPWNAEPQWDGLHTWTDAIDEHIEALGF